MQANILNSKCIFKQVFGSLVVCLVVPYLLAIINLARSPALYIFTFGTFWNCILEILCFPFLPLILIILEHQTELKMKSYQPDEYEFVLNKERHKQIKKQTAAFIRTELGLETTPQIILSLLLLILSASQTRTLSGVEAFDETKDVYVHESEQSGFNYFNDLKDKLMTADAKIAFIIMSNVWSVFSTYTSFIRSISSTKCHFPIVSKLMLLPYVILSVGLKFFGCILFLTPTLGLFSLSRHFQGELFPYWTAMDVLGSNSVNVTTDQVYFSNIPAFPWSTLTRYNYTDPKNPIPPKYEDLYTIFSLKTYLIFFWIILAVQAILTIFVKKVTNLESFARKNWTEKITHCMENVWIPAPLEDWDDTHGTISHYRERQRTNLKEIGCTLLLNLLFNLVLLVPIWIFGKN